jgi:hypothetical protein
MPSSILDPELTELATGFKVRDYRVAVDAQAKDKIADALRKRFAERYIDPALHSDHKHGFTMMAISCLMIEALESFRQGWENSDGKSKAAFCHFFDSSNQFSDFRGHSQQFYKHVRCGILHQAETTGGWRITRKQKAALFELGSLTVNATCFLNHLREVLDDFCNRLRIADWDSHEWRQVRKKMKALCANCHPQDLY